MAKNNLKITFSAIPTDEDLASSAGALDEAAQNLGHPDFKSMLAGDGSNRFRIAKLKQNIFNKIHGEENTTKGNGGAKIISFDNEG